MKKNRRLIRYCISAMFLLISKWNWGQQPTEMIIKGQVTNEQHIPLAGVSVVTPNGTGGITNAKGAFELYHSFEDSLMLTLTAIGYEKTIVYIKRQETHIRVILPLAAKGLDQVIVTGYGKSSQRLSTGSITKISSDVISLQPVANPLAALQGRVPGLIINASSGLPGASMSVQIRGQNTITPNPNVTGMPMDNPYFIIDGVPFASQNSNINQINSMVSPGNSNTWGNATGGLSPFSMINPSDIESIEVLRDADATSIYGSRGANGVILITTKKGISGKTNVQLNIQRGYSSITRMMPMLNTSQYLQLRREAILNDGYTLTNVVGRNGYAPEILIFDTTKYTNWTQYFFGGTAKSTNANLSISGGSINTNFSVNVGYRKDGNVFPGDFSAERGSAAVNLHHNSNNRRFFVDFSSLQSIASNNTPGTPSLLQAFTLPPNYPDLLDPEGNLVWQYKGVNLTNPLSYLERIYQSKNFSINGQLQLGYEIARGLHIKSSMGYSRMQGSERSLTPRASYAPNSTTLGAASFTNNLSESVIWEPQLDYNRLIGKGRLNVLLGGSYQDARNTGALLSGSNYANDNLLGTIAGAGNITATDKFNQYKYAAIFSRLNYQYAGKYIVNLTARRDGSSKFGPGKRFGNFGAIGASWIFTEESVLKNNKILSFEKLRGSLGTTGSDNIDSYLYLSLWSPTVPYLGTIGYIPQNLFNETLHWSVNKKAEASIELGFVQNSLMLNATWYKNRSGNQLVTYVLPAITGFRGITSNFPALVENNGWELMLTYTTPKTSRVVWNSSVNFTIPKNKLVAFPDLHSSSYNNVYFIGEPVSSIMAYQSLGVDPATGLYTFTTADGPSSTPAFSQRSMYNQLDPYFYGGWSNTVSYKGIQLDIFLEFKKQNGFNYLRYITAPGSVNINLPAVYMNRWHQEGEQAEIQKLSSAVRSPAVTALNNFKNSNGIYSDASFIRGRNLSLSYTINNKILKQLSLTHAKLFLLTQNLFTNTSYKGNDPETRSLYSIPPMKNITFGFQVAL
ncbi:SusC/RagA family TonB-linked outer membrane protein [Niabella yanshanensis]|uniref:SusC/RagA family TonB-linked outer membrane protein n=1 Tax=Niabella yanshanensis TaxID=577386 RepID=A0ABZ0W3Y0_9BACT|nr:SusC/RagA family TonB-linked outer membrane protein [Niabella yanshanensis]WQD36780.1 SusC/RagA family TonB-linked outer membrane protein [Niabella yanshanensis]